jgi:endonuclease/exonuclease/phosphatase family metal-dependent hydrolase
LIFNIIAAAGLLFAYLANYISPAQFWIFGFMGMAYPFILIANILFIVYWIIVRKKEFLISFLAIALGWGVVKRTFQMNIVSRNYDNKDAIRVMTYNVRLFNMYRQNIKTNDRDSILKLIRNKKPTILCLQEFGTDNNVDTLSDNYIKDKLSFLPYSYIHKRKSESGSEHYGIATFSKYPIINRGRFEFNNSVNMFIYTDIIVGTDTLRVFNMHLESTGIRQKDFHIVDNLVLDVNRKNLRVVKNISLHLRDAFSKRSEQADFLADLIGRSPYRILLCGDFNDTPVSYTYYQIKRNLKDAFTEAGKGTSLTYHESFPSFRIDYILHDKTYKARYYEVPKIDISDHYPVFCIMTKRK